MGSGFPAEILWEFEHESDAVESEDFGDTEVSGTDEEYIRIQLEAHDKG